MRADWVPALRRACQRAGDAILAYRHGTVDVELKADGSPVSAADMAAARIISAQLRALDPALEVVCEEDPRCPAPEAAFWLVDPLDGTREFLRGSDRFSINIALVSGARAVFGMVYAPVSGRCWWGGAAGGAFLDGRPIRSRRLGSPPRLLVSPNESQTAVDALLPGLCPELTAALVEPMPGAFKFCELAEGRADVYPRSVPSCGWDSAAGQAVLEGAGGAVLDLQGEVLTYAPSRDWRNPAFVAVGDASADWTALLAGLAGAPGSMNSRS